VIPENIFNEDRELFHVQRTLYYIRPIALSLKKKNGKNANQHSAGSGICIAKKHGIEPYRPVACLLLLKWVADREPAVQTGMFVKAGIREQLLLL